MQKDLIVPARRKRKFWGFAQTIKIHTCISFLAHRGALELLLNLGSNLKSCSIAAGATT